MYKFSLPIGYKCTGHDDSFPLIKLGLGSCRYLVRVLGREIPT